MEPHELHSIVTAILVSGCAQQVGTVSIHGPEAANLVACQKAAATIVRESRRLGYEGDLT